MRETRFNGYTVCLIESVEEIQSLKSLFSPKVMCGVDTETKSLEYKEDQVVGVCLSGGSDYTVQGYRGYYLPIRHVSYNNLPIKEVMDITQWVIDTHQTVFHNRNFDASMLEFDGIKIPFVGGMHDSQIMCYLTFNEPYPALKDYCTRFLKWDMIEFSENNAEDHNFGCFSADTKFLTKSGFKLFDDISEGEEIAQYNPDTKKLEFVTPTNRFDYFANNLYRIHSERVDSIITDNHRVYSRAREEYKVLPASCVFGKQRTLQLGTEGFDGSYEIRTYFEDPTVLVKRQGKEWSRTYGRDIQFQKESLLKYLGFYLGDGTCPKYNSGYGSFEIFQSKSEVKEETVEWLKSIEVGDFVHYSETDRMVYWKIHQRTFCDWVWSNFVVDGIKRVPRWVYDMPIEDRKILLDAFVRADGHYRKDRKSYWIDVLSSKELAEDVLELCISVGLSAKMSVYSVDLSRVPTLSGKEVHLRKDKHYRIHVHPNKETKLSVDNWSLAKPQRVVCFSVPSTLLVVQRNYKTYISGNSTDPTVSFKYAAGDPVATVMLARKMWNDYPYIRSIYKIDNYTLEAVRLLCKNELTLDYDFLENLKDVTERKLKEIQTRIYSMSGVYGFNIDSAKDKADILSRFVTLTEKTKSGKFKTDEEALSRLNHPIATLMIEYAQTRVFLKSFVAKMCSYKGRTIRANYNTVNVPSGRLSSGGSSGNPYFIPQNLQNVPKEEERLFLHHHPFMGYMLDWKEEGCVRDVDGNPIKIKTKTGLHRAFIPHDPDWVILSSDYAAQEIRLAANFSKEPNFVEPLLEGKDIHMYVAKKMFGYEDPDHRTKVKIVNFSALYGAEGPTIAKRAGVSLDEGKALFAKYKTTMSKLYAWKAEVIKAAKRRGYALTYFGRPIYLLKFLSSSDRKNVAYAERLAVNSVVQGCLPSMTFVPSQDGKTFKTFHALIAERIKFAKDEKGLERLGVPTYRGKDSCEFVVFDSGDFIIVSRNHKFLEHKSETNLLSISQAFNKPVEMMKPAKKCKLWQSILKTILCSNDYFHLTTLQVRSVRDEAPAYDSKVAYSLFRAWLFQETIKTNNQWSMHTMRSLVDLYGYNLVIVEPGKYKLSWSRRKKAKVIYTTPCGIDNVVSPSMISGYQTYPLSGFIHKNTGADLMRLFLIKFTMLNKNNEEWRNNTRLILPVHDEQNIEVHKDYLYKAWKYMKKVMNFKPDNFVIPIVVDSGVGTSWGNCLDFECVSPKNRIVPKDLDPDRLPDEERQYLIDIIKECNEEDLPDKLKKFR